MTIHRRSTIATLSFIAASAAAWLLGRDVLLSLAVGVLVAIPVFVASGLGGRRESRLR
jgi:hypothetical protein